ncbi:hypothetical protein JTE90_007780, partial [Oedothorax gibbosus]
MQHDAITVTRATVINIHGGTKSAETTALQLFDWLLHVMLAKEEKNHQSKTRKE